MVTALDHLPSRTAAACISSARARRRQRGASIFVVMSVLMVLTALGIFAVHNAGLNQRMSGYSKQATQSAYIADMGTLTVVDEMSGGAVAAYMQLVADGAEKCHANREVPGDNLPCYRLTKSDLETRILGESGVPMNLVDTKGLSTPLSPLTADFVVELTDLGPSMKPVPGMAQSDVGPRFRYMQVTLSGLGHVRPAPGTVSDGIVARIATVRANRAVVQAGPVPW